MNSDKIDINECEFGLWDDEIHYEDVQKHDEFDYEYKTDFPTKDPFFKVLVLLEYDIILTQLQRLKN